MRNDKNIGQTFGIYTILGIAPERDADGHLLYVCECSVCKTKTTKRLFDIKRFNTQCHHMRSCWENSRIGDIFKSMINRCYNPLCKDYKWYGQTGIAICDEWKNNPKEFELWAVSNGYNDTMTIDRVESDRNYSPENCQWISREENSRKAGKVNWIVVGEYRLTGHQWSQKLGIGINVINTAIRNHGEEKTKELIAAMLKESPSTKKRNPNQSWFDVYGIQV
jgi:hypothetical protein